MPEIKLPNSDQIKQIIDCNKTSISQKGAVLTGRISNSVPVSNMATILDVKKFSLIDKLGYLIYGDDATPDKIAVYFEYYTSTGTTTPLPSLGDPTAMYLNLLNEYGDPFYTILRYNPTTKKYTFDANINSPMVCPYGFRIRVRNLSATHPLEVRMVHVYRDMEVN